MLEQLQESKNKLVGAKQVRRALLDGRACCLFLAEDAQSQVTQPLVLLAEERAVAIERVPSMKALGNACGIAVGAAVAVILS